MATFVPGPMGVEIRILPQALVQGVPQGRLVLLDLYAEVFPLWSRTQSFYGAPFMVCMLHNFGGNLGAFAFPRPNNMLPHQGSHACKACSPPNAQTPDPTGASTASCPWGVLALGEQHTASS